MEKKDRVRKQIGKAAWGLLAFLGTGGICYVSELAGYKRASFTIFTVAVLVVVWRALLWAKEDLAAIADVGLRRRRILLSALISYLFSVSMIAGYQLQSYGMTDGGFAGKGMLLLRAACLTAAVFPAGNLFLKLLERIPAADKEGGKKIRTGVLFGVSAGVTFLCLIPVWLAYYPIVMSYDFHRQINEAAKGFIWFYPYQPIAHTWIIWLFMRIGESFGSLETGMACMAVFQIVLYALVTGYAVTMVYRVARRLGAAVVTLLFFALFPFNTVLVVCTTKDVLFTVLFLLFFLMFVERTFFCAGKKRILLDVLLVLEGSLMVQFRNNAFYALAVFLVLYFLFAPKKEKLEAVLLAVLLITGSKATQFVILKAIGTQIPAPKIEMYSVPIQQFARVGKRHKEDMDPETAYLLEHYLEYDIWEAYNPPISDTVKGSGKVHEESFTDTGQFLKDWIEIGKKYPNEYIDAFLELTRGYWFWDDVSWAENLGFGVEGRMGVIFTYNSSEIEGYGSIEHESRFPWLEQQLEQVVSANCFYKWPVFSVFFKSAFYCWALFLVMAAYWYLRRGKMFLAGLLPFLYFATMLLGPVVQMRYLFPVVCSLPVMIALLWLPIRPCAQDEKTAEKRGAKADDVR